MKKAKPKRKRKAAVAKHIVVHAPLKLHIIPEIVAGTNTLNAAKQDITFPEGAVVADPHPSRNEPTYLNSGPPTVWYKPWTW